MDSMHVRRAVALALFSCAACRTYQPEPLDPLERAEALAQRGRGTAQDAPAGSLADLAVTWFPLAAVVDLRDGLTLEEANSLALLYAPRILEARSHARVEGIQLLQAGLLDNPELFLGPRLIEGSPGVNFPASLSFVFPLGDRRDARQSAAEASVDVARQRVSATELESLATVRRHFVTLGALDQEIALHRSMHEATRLAADQAERKQVAGEMDEFSRYLARLEQQEAEQTLQDRILQRQQVVLDLLGELGLPPGEPLEILGGPELLQVPDLGASNARQARRHPLLQAAAAEYRRAEQDLRLEVARQYPDLNLGPDYEDDDGTKSLGVGLSLRLPLFDRNHHAIDAAEERRRAQRQEYDAVLLRQARVEAAARAEWQTAHTLLTAHQEQTTALADAADAALQARLERGMATVLEALTARRAVARARLREVELRRRVASSALQAAVAGGLVLAEPPMQDVDPANQEDAR